jgi:imidazolonepropionase-like amidohydrolase
MIRLGKKYENLISPAGCNCCNPAVRQVSHRLEEFTRRHFLAGTGATFFSSLASTSVFAQPAKQNSKILFRQARLFDGKSESLRDVQVLIEGNTISSIDASNASPPSDALAVNCGNRVLMPGLIDAHWHTLLAAMSANALVSADPGFIFAAATAEANRTLLRGFTTVRDMGGPVFTFKQAIDSGIIPGPRIFPSGAMITTSGGHGDLRVPTEIPRSIGQLSPIERLGGAMLADSAGELQLRIREQLLQGASQIKLVGGGGVSSPRSPLDMTTFSEEDLRVGIGVARDWNTYAAVHAYAPHTIQRAIAAGAVCIEHAHLIDDDTAKLMADKGVWLSTQPFLSTDDTAPLTGPSLARTKVIFERTPRLYEFIRKYKIKTAWGSDLLFSAEVARRQGVMLSHLANWYSNAEILRMATSTNAELLGLSNKRHPYPGKIGVIEKGALADLLVVNGNPLDNIKLIEDPDNNLAVIMKDGKLHKNTLNA